MPVFLSDKETLYTRGVTEGISDAYRAKLAQNIRKKLAVLKTELIDLNQNEEFKPYVAELVAYLREEREVQPVVTDLD